MMKLRLLPEGKRSERKNSTKLICILTLSEIKLATYRIFLQYAKN